MLQSPFVGCPDTGLYWLPLNRGPILITINDDRTTLRFDRLTALGLPHAVTTRRIGVGPFEGNLGFGVGDDLAATIANRRRAAAAIGLTANDLVAGYQVHGAAIATVGIADRGRGAVDPETRIPATDGLATNNSGVGLLTLLADCAALVLFAPDTPALGQAHLGWRGTVARLGESLVRTLVEQYGVRPDRFVGAITPAIGPCCYEVGPDVVEVVEQSFRDPGALLLRSGERTTFDIPAAILQQLTDAGVSAEQIDQPGICTSCRTDLFFSHRAERGKTGRFGLVSVLPA